MRLLEIGRAEGVDCRTVNSKVQEVQSTCSPGLSGVRCVSRDEIRFVRFAPLARRPRRPPQRSTGPHDVVRGQLPADFATIAAARPAALPVERPGSLPARAGPFPGESAAPEQVEEVHAGLRKCLEGLDEGISMRTRILYGGSVTEDNAAALFGMKNVDGALVGGASLKANSFVEICKAAEESQ